MTPNISTPTGVLYETDEEVKANVISEKVVTPTERKLHIIWSNVFVFTAFHLFAMYGLYMAPSAKIGTILTLIFSYYLHGIGIGVGAHRLWTHRGFKAKLPLKIFLVFCNGVAFENSIFVWARDHRAHHKYSETDADPHNAKRGFFFAHIGWLLCSKHPDVKEKGKTIDMSDLAEDPIVMFQHKYYFALMPMMCFVLPTVIPMYFWNETLVNSFCINMLRYVLALHATWSINSAAHMWGQKPYDNYINPAESRTIAILTFGEGWHNYHHVFPWDYKTSELGTYATNLSCMFVDFMAKLGLAYDLKSVSKEMIRKRVERTGDGTHPIWGWGDKDQPKDDYEDVIITYKKSNATYRKVLDKKN